MHHVFSCALNLNKKWLAHRQQMNRFLNPACAEAYMMFLEERGGQARF